ncbi:MAG TPA: diguanylate cyclase [Arenimonas sp.]|nr:diguanylate cyclase [Arenimonas sp.]
MAGRLLDRQHIEQHPWVLAGLIALVYLASARLGFLTALPPGNVTALWPASGIALAAVVLFGRRMLWGVALGSFIANLWSLGGAAGVAVAAAIAAGSTLQTAVAGELLRRRFGNACAPRYGREVLDFLFLVALATLIAPSCGSAALVWGDHAAPAQLGELWRTWWLGDYAGILTFAPLLIVLGRHLLREPVAELALFPLTTLWFGVTLIAFFFVQQLELSAAPGQPPMRAWLLLGVGLGLNALATWFIDTRQRADRSLRQSEAYLRRLFDESPDAVLVVDEAGIVLHANAQVESVFGYAPAELVGDTVLRLMPERIRSHHPELMARYFTAPTRRQLGDSERQLVGRRRDGREIPVDIMLSPVQANGSVRAIAVVRDISARLAAEARIRELNLTLEARVEERTASLQQEIAAREKIEAVLQQAHDNLQRSVDALAMRNSEISLLRTLTDFLYAAAEVDEAVTTVHRFLPLLFPRTCGVIYLLQGAQFEARLAWGEIDTSALPALEHDACWALRRGHVYSFDGAASMPCAHFGGPEPLPFHACCAPVIGSGELLGMLHVRFAPAGPVEDDGPERLLSDVAEQLGLVLANLRLRQSLSEQAMRDPLTRVYNRRHMELALLRELRRCARSRAPLSLAMIDIDHFKRFNDEFGHQAGDQVLASIAALLSDSLRASDVICRYGGEEFVILLCDSSCEGAAPRLEQLRLQVQELRLRHGTQALPPLTVSIGLAAFPDHALDSRSLVEAADAALYRAKDGGRNRVCVAD